MPDETVVITIRLPSKLVDRVNDEVTARRKKANAFLARNTVIADVLADAIDRCERAR
jgi:metal-responsive CopG/Arc/MetJ family transcriptional regulator